MRNSSALLPVGTTEKQGYHSVEDALRVLLSLAEHDTDTEPHMADLGVSGEEILIDTEVNGSRYLLLRMPKLGRIRAQLSPREQEIVRMVAKGHPNKIIADVLNISSWTVCTHLRRIFAKLGVNSRAAMVAELLELGALPREWRRNEQD